MLADRAVIESNESAMRQVMRARQVDTPVKAPATAFLK
jgi:hypothetical protein